MSIKLSTIADSITNIVVSGLTIKDINQIPTSVIQRDCPLMIPSPEDYVSNFTVQVDSFGTGSQRKMTLTYQLNYILVFAEVGIGRTNVLDAYSGMLTKACAFLDAFYALDNLTGAVDFDAELGNPSITEISGKSFHSIDIRLIVKEFVN